MKKALNLVCIAGMAAGWAWWLCCDGLVMACFFAGIFLGLNFDTWKKVYKTN